MKINKIRFNDGTYGAFYKDTFYLEEFGEHWVSFIGYVFDKSDELTEYTNYWLLKPIKRVKESGKLTWLEVNRYSSGQKLDDDKVYKMIKFPSEELLDIAIQKHIVYRDWEQQKERQEIEARELQDYNNLYQIISYSECKPIPVVTEPAMNKELKPKLTFEEVCESLRLERTAQDQKWGPLEERRQSVSGYITILEAELSGAKKGWVRNVEGKHSSLAEIRQLAAVAIACLQQYGFEGTPL